MHQPVVTSEKNLLLNQSSKTAHFGALCGVALQQTGGAQRLAPGLVEIFGMGPQPTMTERGSSTRTGVVPAGSA